MVNNAGDVFTLAQKGNTRFTNYKDQVESNRYARYISYR